MKLFYEVRSQKLFVGDICHDPFPLHVHAVVEIVSLYKGSMRLTVSGHAYEVNPGDTIAIFPSMAHSYDYVSPDAEGLCIIFVPETIREFANTFHTMRPVSPLLAAQQHEPAMIEAMKALETVSKQPDSPFLTCNLHVYLAHLLTALQLEPLDKHVDNSLTQRAIQYVADHAEEPLTLESVSAGLGISPSHLSHLFS